MKNALEAAGECCVTLMMGMDSAVAQLVLLLRSSDPAAAAAAAAPGDVSIKEILTASTLLEEDEMVVALAPGEVAEAASKLPLSSSGDR